MTIPSVLLAIPVALPVLCGALLFVGRPGKRAVAAVSVAVSAVTAVLVWAMILFPPEGTLRLVRFTDSLSIAFHLDGAGRVFAAIAATLWPLSSLYADEYMAGDSRRRSFFGFYTICLGVTVGICFAANLMTMYLFYELLTLFTIPLVIHPLTHRAVHAARKYMYFSFGGTAFAFMALVFLSVFGSGADFTGGGVLAGTAASPAWVRLIWFLGFMGFGVKAAVFPLHSWLPDASVAPTPVTALLHAVAVVKSGVFAVIRLTYFCFGTAAILGTWAQTAAFAVALFTMLFGSVKAVREPHLKRRLAYSTVANLSYILTGVLLLTPDGLTAGFWHMLSHALMKICVFFCAGAVMNRTGKEYVSEMGGAGRSLPVTMACFTFCSAALAGIPPTAGFISKYSLITACLSAGGWAGTAGAAVLLTCGLLTAIYLFTVVARAYFPRKGAVLLGPAGDPGPRMLVPIALTAAAVLAFGLWTGPVTELVRAAVTAALGV